MTDEIEKIKSDHEVKIGRKTMALTVARLKKDVVLEEVNIIVGKGNIGCLMNEFGQLLFCLSGEVEGLPIGSQVPVHPDEVELL